MIKKDIKLHSIIYETQWPRIMELQLHYMRACEWQNNFFAVWFKKGYKERTAAPREKINEHFRWMLKQQFGDDVQWDSMYVPRRGILKGLPRGTGYRGEILQFIFYNKAEEDDE